MRNGPFQAVDIGNSSIKIGLFAGTAGDFPKPQQVISIPSPQPRLEPVRSLKLDPESPWFLASVCRPACQSLLSWLRQEVPRAVVRELTHLDFPLSVNVLSPARVGLDRLAAATAVNRLRCANRAAIVVDAGSAITVDAISESGVFLGGAILAGMSMQARSLNQNTDRLPLIEDPDHMFPDVIGRDTDQAIRSGIQWGTIGAVRELVSRMRNELGSADLFVAGGDMERIAPHLDHAHIVSHLVLSGIAIAATCLVPSPE